jgi:hypothetical protein
VENTLCVSALCLTLSYTVPTSKYFSMFQLFEPCCVSRFMNLMPRYDYILSVIPLLFVFFDICYNSLHIRTSSQEFFVFPAIFKQHTGICMLYLVGVGLVAKTMGKS